MTIAFTTQLNFATKSWSLSDKLQSDNVSVGVTFCIFVVYYYSVAVCVICMSFGVFERSIHKSKCTSNVETRQKQIPTTLLTP